MKGLFKLFLRQNRIIRFFDFLISILLLVALSPVFTIFLVLVWFECRSPIFLQVRLGKNLKPFTLIKFRTMSKLAPSVSSHLSDPNLITKIGRFIRTTKIDELPQLINVVKGDMSLVGPRPGLLTQYELINARTKYDVYTVKPGITGLSQIKGIDMSTPELLARSDAEMISKMNVVYYFKILALTALGKGKGDAASRKSSAP